MSKSMSVIWVILFQLAGFGQSGDAVGRARTRWPDAAKLRTRNIGSVLLDYYLAQDDLTRMQFQGSFCRGDAHYGHGSS